MRTRLRELVQDGATTGQVATWDGTKWAPTTIGGSGGGSASGVSSIAVINNASVSASTGAVTITNSLTPSWTSATVATSNPAYTLTDGTYTAQLGVASAAGNYHSAAGAGDLVLRSNNAGVNALLVANASSSGYVKVANTSVTLGGTVNTTGNLTENGTRVLTGVSVANNASVSVTGGAATITNSLTPVFTSATIPTLTGPVTVTGVPTFSSAAVFNAGITTKDFITGGGGAGIGNLAAQAVYGYNIKDGAITYDKLSLGAIATIQTNPVQTRTGFTRYFAASTQGYSADSDGNTVGLNSQAPIVTDGLAFAGYAAKATAGTTANGTYISYGPYYGQQGNTSLGRLKYPNQGPGLAPGKYRAKVFLRVPSIASSSNVVGVAAYDNDSGRVVENGVFTYFTPAQIGSTSYTSIAIPFTISADTYTTTAGGGLEIQVLFQSAAATDLYVSHIVVDAYDGPSPQEVTTTFIRDAAVTDAKITSLTASKIAAGTINVDDIFIGSSGHIYAGTKGGARVELNSGGLYAYSSGATQTFALLNTGSLSMIGSLTTGTSAGRMVMSQAGAYGSLNMYSGDSLESSTSPGVLYNTVYGSGTGRQLITTLQAATGAGGHGGYGITSQITLASSSLDDVSEPATISLYGNQINFLGPGGAFGNEIGMFGYLSMVGYPVRYDDASGVPRGYVGTCTLAGGYLTDNAVNDLFIRSENGITRIGGVATDSTVKVDAANTTSNNVAIKGKWFANGICGSTAVTTTAGGAFTITHNLNNSSHVMTMVTNSAAAEYWQITARNANTTDFNLRSMSTGASVASATRTFFWMVAPY